MLPPDSSGQTDKVEGELRKKTMRRIPRIKFPQRRPKSSSSASGIGSVSETQPTPTTRNTIQNLLSRSRSDVPAAPSNTAVGGQASLQPKRTPVINREIEAVLLGFYEEP